MPNYFIVSESKNIDTNFLSDIQKKYFQNNVCMFLINNWSILFLL